MILEDSHRPTFDKYGGDHHLRISQVEDLKHILTLADGRWMATSCPTFGLKVDPAFIKFLDADGNRRIISNEVRGAISWTLERLRPSETWKAQQPALPINLINSDHPDGKVLESAARLVLENLGLPDATEVSLEQIRNRQGIISQATCNGDGIIPPEAIEDPETAQFARDLVATLGGVSDASGLKGVNEEILDRFRKEASAYLGWYAQGVIPEDQTSTDIMSFGAATPTMFQAIASVRDKIEQFFAQCELVRFDARMEERVGPREDEIAQLDYKDRNAILEYLRLAPLAKPNSKFLLPLNDDINELYSGPIGSLRTHVILPIFGDGANTLNEVQWREILGKFASYEAWLKSKPTATVEALGVDKLRAYLDASYDADIREMIFKDRDVADEIQRLQGLERLILYHQWLFEFVNNYVSFPRLFDPEHRAIFEMGTLILEGREFALSLRVENRSVNSNLAKNGGMYLLYLQITGSKPEDSFEIVTPVTKGGSRGFYVGRRGVFLTMDGRELDAQIVQIVENPISLWESMKEPFRKLRDIVERRFTQLTTTIQKEAETGIGKVGAGAETSIQTDLRQAQQEGGQPAVAAPPPSGPGGFSEPSKPEVRTSGSARDLMIGVGFLAAGVGTAFKFLVDAAKQLSNPRTVWILLIVIGVFLAIGLIVTTISAWLRLRRRDLGVLLQASGWAINGRMRIIRPMARFFSRKTQFPEGSRKGRRDLLISIERLARKKKLIKDKGIRKEVGEDAEQAV